MNEPAFIPGRLASVLADLASAPDYLVAYSGGMDSHVLLHALSRLAAEQHWSLSAIHIHHGLHAHADDWAEHCRRTCHTLAIPLDIVHVDAKSRKGESPEAMARMARYTAFEERLQPGQVLLTAHHLDDQVETFMLQLLRGSGLRGISAMPLQQPFARGMLVRPFLEVSREALEVYAGNHALEWIEDSSNTDTAYDRNYLRHKVMPLLFARWPSARQTIARAAGHAAETVAMAEMLARQDLIKARHVASNALSTFVLLALTPERRRNLLRVWIRDQDLPQPSTRRLERIATEILEAGADRVPVVHWEGAEVRRYRDKLYLMPPLPVPVAGQCLVWQPDKPPSLPLGTLQENTFSGCGVRAQALLEYPVEIRFRGEGEKIRPAGSGHHRSLKKLFQEHAVPPWLRDLLPLIYINGTLAAVPGICVAAEWAATGPERGVEFSWRLPPSLADILPVNEPLGREKD